jgi:hypothetical protein
MPADLVGQFKALLDQSPTDPNALNRVIADLIGQGSRREAIRCARFLRRRNLDNADSIKAELVNLLSLGKDARAKAVFSRYQDDPRLAPSFKWMFERYLNRTSLVQEVRQSIQATQQALVAEIRRSQQRSTYLQALSGFSDYILVSNSNRLQFSDEDKAVLRSLERPLFIYSNIGNPLILPIRGSLYNSQAREVVIGGFKNLYTATGELFFQPWTTTQFLGALTRVNPKFLATWQEQLSEPVRRINQPSAIYELEEDLLINAFYPLTLFSTSGINQPRLCTNGWIALCLFDAIALATRPTARLWSAGFSMSPSYVFESCDALYFHDYPFEKTGLELRIAEGSLISIGSTKSDIPEASTAGHLDQAGIKSEKLVDFKKRTGQWPKL